MGVPGHTESRRLTGCVGKQRHPSFLDAKRHLKRIGMKCLNAYRCPFCGGWHVGTRLGVAAKRRAAAEKGARRSRDEFDEPLG